MTDYSRSFEHGKGVPGIFFKYDLEGMILTIRERTTSLYQFLIRLVGVVGESFNKRHLLMWSGGVWTVASFGLRVFNRAHREVAKVVSDKKEYIPSSLATPSPSFQDAVPRNGYFGYGGSGNTTASTPLGGDAGVGERYSLAQSGDLRSR